MMVAAPIPRADRFVAAPPEELPALLALDRVPGLGSRTLLKLLQACESPRRLWDAFDSVILATNLPESRAESLINAWREVRARLEPDALLAQCASMGVTILALGAPAYPPTLASLHDPPALLYLRGNPDALRGKTLGFVGTRKMSTYGRQVTERLIADLAPSGVTVVSGLAMGVDACAHQAALRHGLPTVAVFGCGIDQIYPRAHESLASEILAHGGALVSEYPPGTPGSRATFPQRNRIIAGLSYGVAVMEGDVASGSMITARVAMEEGRAVFAAPGNLFSPGSQGPIKLLKQGATLIACADDILNELRWLRPDQARQGSLFASPPASGSPAPPQAAIPSDLSPDERRVLALIEFEPTPVERVQQDSGLPPAVVNQGLTMLELAGLIAELPGAKVCRV